MKLRTQTKELRAVLHLEEYEALDRLSSNRGQTQAATMRDLIRSAAARKWEDAAAPRLQAVEEMVNRLEEGQARLAKRLEDLVAIVRSAEQGLLKRLDQQDQLLDPMARMLTLTTLRVQAIEELHPSTAVRERVQTLFREVGG